MPRTRNIPPRRSRRRGVAAEMIVVAAAMAALIAAVIGGLIGAALMAQNNPPPPTASAGPTGPTTGTSDPLELYASIEEALATQQEVFDDIDRTGLEDALDGVQLAQDAGEDPSGAIQDYEEAYALAMDDWQSILDELDALEAGPLAELAALDPTLADGLRSMIDSLRRDVEDDRDSFPGPEELGGEPCAECQDPDEELPPEEDPEEIGDSAPVWEVVMTTETLESGLEVIRDSEIIQDPDLEDEGYQRVVRDFFELHADSDYSFHSYRFTAFEPLEPEEGETLADFAERVMALDPEMDESDGSPDGEEDPEAT